MDGLSSRCTSVEEEGGRTTERRVNSFSKSLVDLSKI